LTTLLNEGTVKYIEDSSRFFDKIIAVFPIESYRIDWDRLPHREKHIDKNYPECKEDISKFVTDIFFSEKIDQKSEVFVCFDGYTEGALSMPLSFFILYASEILTYPQHAYIIPENASWCLNYTMEHYLNF